MKLCPLFSAGNIGGIYIIYNDHLLITNLSTNYSLVPLIQFAPPYQNLTGMMIHFYFVNKHLIF